MHTLIAGWILLPLAIPATLLLFSESPPSLWPVGDKWSGLRS